jgi:hypothetical protein
MHVLFGYSMLLKYLQTHDGVVGQKYIYGIERWNRISSTYIIYIAEIFCQKDN